MSFEDSTSSHCKRVIFQFQSLFPYELYRYIQYIQCDILFVSLLNVQYRAALTSYLICNLQLWTFISEFHFLSFWTPHTLSDIPSLLFIPYIHIWYCWIQHNPTFPTSHLMYSYDNSWQSNYKVNDNILHRNHFFHCPLILGMCLQVSIYFIHQDIHIQLFPVGALTPLLQTCQVSKLSELVLSFCISLSVLTPIRTGYILGLFLFGGI